MQFLKAHYEKIILSLVLLGLAAAVALMPVKVSQEKQRQVDQQEIFLPKKVKELEPIDLSTNKTALARVAAPHRSQLSGSHNVFNPVPWKKRPDGSIYKADDGGVRGLEVAEISPLKLRVEFEAVTGTPESVRYRLTVLNEAVRSAKTPREAGVGDKNNMFAVEKIVGDDPSNPKALQVLLAGDRQPVMISKEEPYERVVGYAADLRLKVEEKQWKDLKVKDELNLGGETYKIVAITQNEVVLSANSNKKQTVLEYKPPQR